MSRVLAYLGPSIALSRLVLEPTHNLMTQARSPREMHHADLNSDGFGFGWYAADDSAAVYRRRSPIWHDHNLADIARSLESDLWLAAVLHDEGTAGDLPRGMQPLREDALLFVHDGRIPGFHQALRDAVLDFIDPEIAYGLAANAPSDLLFGVLRHLLANDCGAGVETAIGQLYALLDEWLPAGSAQANILVSDGERLFVGRHAVRSDCPTLYYTTDDDAFPDAQVVASEPLTESEFWHVVPEDAVLILDPMQPPELIALETMPDR